MSYLMGFIFGWEGLLVAMLITRRFAEFAMPRLVVFAWKATVVIAMAGAAGAVLDRVNWWVGLAASLAVYAGLMAWLFRLDLFQVLVFTVASRLLAGAFYAAIIAAIIVMQAV